jgi:hypothetical protein
MNATLLCLALLVPGYGEKDIRKALADAGVRDGTLTFLTLFDSTEKRYGPYDGLGFNRVRGTDALLAELCEIPPVEGLSFDDSDVTDAGMAAIGALKGLKYLRLGKTGVTDAGLRRLERMSSLELLRLVDCPGVTDEGVARLQKALPECKIWR